MTPQEWADKTAVEQGFPPKVEDAATLARVAQIITTSKGKR